LKLGDMDGKIKELRDKFHKAQRSMMRDLANESSVYAKSLFGNPQPSWPPLAQRTLKTHAQNAQSIIAAGGNPPNTPLLVTGELRDTVERSYGQTWAAAGSDSPVMLFQELGGPNPEANAQPIPPRPVFQLTQIEMGKRLPEIVRKNFDPIFGGSSGVSDAVTADVSVTYKAGS